MSTTHINVDFFHPHWTFAHTRLLRLSCWVKDLLTNRSVTFEERRVLVLHSTTEEELRAMYPEPGGRL